MPPRLPAEERFVVMGVGRSGLRYVSDMLNSLGVETGYESIFNSKIPIRLRSDCVNVLRWKTLSGDAASGAGAYMKWFRNDWRLAHVVRDPYDTVVDLWRAGAYAEASEPGVWPERGNLNDWKWRALYAGEIFREPTEMGRCIAHVATLGHQHDHALADRYGRSSVACWKIEDLAKDPISVMELFDWLLPELDVPTITEAAGVVGGRFESDVVSPRSDVDYWDVMDRVFEEESAWRLAYASSEWKYTD